MTSPSPSERQAPDRLRKAALALVMRNQMNSLAEHGMLMSDVYPLLEELQRAALASPAEPADLHPARLAQQEFMTLAEPARLALVGASIAISIGAHARDSIEHDPDKWLCFQFNTWDEVMAALRAVKAWDSAGYRAKDGASPAPSAGDAASGKAAGDEPTWQELVMRDFVRRDGAYGERDRIITLIRARHESGWDCSPTELVKAIRATPPASTEPQEPVAQDGDPNAARLVTEQSPVNKAFWDGVQWAQEPGAGKLEALLCEVAQLLQAAEQEWKLADRWSSRDQSVVDQFRAYRASASQAAPNEPICEGQTVGNDEYMRNLLASCANWLETRSQIPRAGDEGGLMRNYAADLLRIRDRLASQAAPQPAGDLHAALIPPSAERWWGPNPGAANKDRRAGWDECRAWIQARLLKLSARHAGAALVAAAPQPLSLAHATMPMRPPSLPVALSMCREANTEVTLPTPMCWDLALYVTHLEAVLAANGIGTAQQAPEPEEDGLDSYGNPLDGSEVINCCYPDCGCDGARLCQAKNGASSAACALNIERGTWTGIGTAQKGGSK